ncbi:DUF202 domain-containing protein [Asanoa sp. NPDC049518]|uniref:DUF202 domain-containing protein n=1 Tax=unclassified Asanoa TaxID=2685164 RepID=UPI003412C302
MSRPGLQTERTALAWTRTATVALVTVILLARLGVHTGQPVLFCGAAAACALALLSFWRRRRRLDAGTDAARARSLLVFTGLTAMCGALAVAGVLAAA